MPQQSCRIGGELEIGPEQLAAPVLRHKLTLPKPFLLWADTGRSAIYLALREIIRRGGKKQAWLPAYCCPSVIAPFAALGFVIRFYSMGPDLQSPAGLPQNLDDGETFLFIHYFGFRNKPIIDWLNSVPGNDAVFVLEDCVQASLNSNVGDVGDYAFTSYRKFLAQPDGALLASNTLCESQLGKADEAFVSGRFVGKLLRQFAPDEMFMHLFEETEKRLDAAIHPAEISWLSGYLMERTDIPAICQARRKNWEEMHQRLANENLTEKWLTPLFKESLGKGETPLGLPVLVHNDQRDKLRNYLRTKSIYCPIHWPLDHLAQQQKDLFPAENSLSSSMLTLPIDQRLGADAMDYFVECIKDFFIAQST